MDFFKIGERNTKTGTEVFADFQVVRSKDLMVRGGAFYAIWDEYNKLWCTDEYMVAKLVDRELWNYRDEIKDRREGPISVRSLSNFSKKAWMDYHSFVKHLPDSFVQLDEHLVFADQEVTKEDYASRRLPYSLTTGDHSAWDELLETLYSEDDKDKIEWAIGAIVSGDSKTIQKFLVLYGEAGAGKSTILNIIQSLFVGYSATFDAKALTGNNNAFSMASFKSQPLVAIQHDGDLSKIEDNTKLNSIVSHEIMEMNEKFKSPYDIRFIAFLFMGTNKPVKITDSKSGIIRRLLDVKPTGNKLASSRYFAIMSQIDFELGAIAQHCLDRYRDMGKHYYKDYVPTDMMLQTDVFYNFVEDNFDTFKRADGVTLNQAYKMYKEFCEEALIQYRLARYKFREELKDYFEDFEERAYVDGMNVRSYYSGFLTSKFISVSQIDEEEHAPSLSLDYTESIFDEMCASEPAQYANDKGIPSIFWTDEERMMLNPKTGKQELMTPPENLVVSTTLSELDTSKLHYVKPPENHIVIDFDLKGEDGNKSAELNLGAASLWPATYAEFSQGGAGIHLHYVYDGDPNGLSRIFGEGIEIKVFAGNSSLRRKLSKCNNIPVAHISSGLPLKEKKLINQEAVKSEKALRELIDRNLRKEIHAGTKPSMDFIHKILDDAYASGMAYDLTDMQAQITAFAAASSNQAIYCLKLSQELKLASEESVEAEVKDSITEDDRLAFFDVEVFPNLFTVCWKWQGSDTVVKMLNPSPVEIEALVELPLVGFNCRDYDNHILYARAMGYNNEQLYKLSQRIVNNEPGAKFAMAYGLSYTDIHDYASEKMSLKKWQIELGLEHKELGLPWDEPVPDNMIEKVLEYNANDVVTTEQVHEARKQDFVARQILANLSGLTVNDKGNKHSAAIIFEGNKKPHEQFEYTDLAEMFPGYEYAYGKSTYRGEIVGEGGYVDAIPGMYEHVGVLDITSMHPNSIRALNLFGPYTKNFTDLVDARVEIKRGNYDVARKMLGGILEPYLQSKDDATALANALKIVINSVYGLTAASYDNPFRDSRNVDNIVAKRGALFMVDLKHALVQRGYLPIHFKTDSVKIPEITDEIVAFIMEFGAKYGYNFEYEMLYEKFCLVNKAVYIAKSAEDGHWDAVGAEFQQPYVFKKLFSKEPLEFKDMCVTKQVTTALYLDFNKEDTPMVTANDPQFIGKVGLFCPVKEEHGGGILLREKDGKLNAASGTKNYRWKEAHIVEAMGLQDEIDMSYFDALADAAADKINEFGDFERFTE